MSFTDDLVRTKKFQHTKNQKRLYLYRKIKRLSQSLSFSSPISSFNSFLVGCCVQVNRVPFQEPNPQFRNTAKSDLPQWNQ